MYRFIGSSRVLHIARPVVVERKKNFIVRTKLFYRGFIFPHSRCKTAVNLSVYEGGGGRELIMEKNLRSPSATLAIAW